MLLASSAGMTKASRAYTVDVDSLADRSHDLEDAIASANNGLDVTRPHGFIVEFHAERPNMAGDEIVVHFRIEPHRRGELRMTDDISCSRREEIQQVVLPRGQLYRAGTPAHPAIQSINLEIANRQGGHSYIAGTTVASQRDQYRAKIDDSHDESVIPAPGMRHIKLRELKDASAAAVKTMVRQAAGG